MAGAGSSDRRAAVDASVGDGVVRGTGDGVRDGKVVVTGARGFLGAAVMAAFVGEGRRCEGWVRDAGLASDASLRADPDRAATSWRTVGDLADARHETLCADLAGVSAVVHLAGRAHLPASIADDAAFERDNV